MIRRKLTFFIIVVLTLALTYLALFGLNIPIGVYDFKIPGAPDMRYGIDIRGGVDAAFQPVGLDRAPTTEELEAARSIMETRLDNANILDREVTIDQSAGHIIVRFPWKSGETNFDPQQAIAELGETARLTFRDPEGTVLVEGKNVVKASAGSQDGAFVVQLEFDSTGATQFDEATARLVGQLITIYMDETEIQSATVQSRISNGEAVITGMAGAVEAKALADKINAGALPFSMESSNHSTISPSLGFGALDVMVQAGVISLAIICLFMILYYRLPGFVACFALLIQVAGQLLALSIPQITLTLPGIAGIILSIGMGVSSNILIAERVAEDIGGGKTLDASITSGFKSAFSSVFDGNITTLLIAFVLLRFGSGAMLSFAYTLISGIVMNFIAGVFLSNQMTRSLSRYKILRNPWLYGCLTRRVAQ